MTGIDTDAGKTVVSALFCLGLDAAYWKPVQAGTSPHTDTEWVRTISRLPDSRFFPEAYRFSLPASPHLSAEAEGEFILEEKLEPPVHAGHLVIEGAGGLMVPLRPDLLYLDMMKRWGLPVILVVRTYLGCINHSLLSIEALRRRRVPLLGIVFNDGGMSEAQTEASEQIIAQYARVPVLGRIPFLEYVDQESLLQLWESEFSDRVAAIRAD